MIQSKFNVFTDKVERWYIKKNLKDKRRLLSEFKIDFSTIYNWSIRAINKPNSKDFEVFRKCHPELVTLLDSVKQEPDQTTMDLTGFNKFKEAWHKIKNNTGSSNGRTAGSESANLGSNPRPVAKKATHDSETI